MEMEIKIKDGRCRVMDGTTKRVFYTTEESMGLYLLKLNPAAQGNGASGAQWVDQLGQRGIAVGRIGDRTLTLTVYPSKKRDILFGRGDTTRTFTVTLPDLLMACSFKDTKFQKALLYVVKSGQTPQLAVPNTGAQLMYYPYGNVYNHGGICWGSTPLKDIHTPDDAFEAFFGSAFNGDLYAYNTNGLLNFLTALSGPEKAFPLPVDSYFQTSVQTVVQGICRL